ncbi:MAG: glycosyltransferase [Gammaproteobacteria bacterium]|jgi:glycosyltransferase involved in cell wall biosynthesis
MSATSLRLVSVIIPFYNAPLEFLQEAVESVRAQSYRLWEILLVDDGSTGPCTDWALRCARQCPDQVRYLEHDGHRNRGSSASRNLGAHEARGDYVAFLDADDVWLPDKLLEQVAILDAQPEAGMLYGNSQYWYSWDADPASAQRDYMPRLGIKSGTLVRPPALLPLFLRGAIAVPCTCSILLRRETLEAIGGFEKQFESMYDDQVLYAKVCLEAPVYVSDRCWDRYRQHPASMCATRDAAHERQSRRRYLEWLEGYLSERRVGNAAVRRALREELWIVRHPAFRRPVEKMRRLVWYWRDPVKARAVR